FLPAIQPWTEEERRLHLEAPDFKFDRTDKMRGFETFVRGQFSALSVYSEQRYFIDQQAYNWSANGPVHDKAVTCPPGGQDAQFISLHLSADTTAEARRYPFLIQSFPLEFPDHPTYPTQHIQSVEVALSLDCEIAVVAGGPWLLVFDLNSRRLVNRFFASPSRM